MGKKGVSKRKPPQSKKPASSTGKSHEMSSTPSSGPVPPEVQIAGKGGTKK